MADETTLHEAALACRRTLVGLVSGSAHGDGDIDSEVHDEDDWAEARLADFNLWASGSGALSNGRASLDNRLRSSPSGRKIVYRSLRMLEAAIRDCQRGGEHETPTSSLALAKNARRKGRSLMSNREIVDRLLAQLYQLTVSIRTSGVKSRLERADNQFEADRYEDLQRHLVILVFYGSIGSLKKLGISEMLPQNLPLLTEETTAASQEHETGQSNASEIFEAVAQAKVNDHSTLDAFKAKWINLWVQNLDSLYLPLDEELPTPDQDRESTENYPDLRSKLSLRFASSDVSETISIKSILERFTEVQKRLIEANLRRRNRFICAQRHARRVQKQRKALEVPQLEKMTEKLVLAGSKKQKEPPVQEHFPTRDNEMKVAGPLRTESSATDPTIPEENLKVSDGSQLPITVVSSTSIQVAYPSAPNIGEAKHRVFRCPCCCGELPIIYLERSKWRKHISEDVLPYTCALPNCPQGLRMYRTRREWEHHMEQEHRTSDHWICHACNPMSKWQSESRFETHLRKDHKSTINAASISTLLKSCHYKSPEELTSCPLCPSPLETERMEPRSLLKHTAMHIHDFSMKSLPWATPAEKERVFVGIPGVDHFDLENNPYFATDSQDDTSAQNQDSRSEGSTQSQSLSDDTHTEGPQKATEGSQEAAEDLWNQETQNLSEADQQRLASLEFNQPHPGKATVIKTLTSSLELNRGLADAVKIGDQYHIFPPSVTRPEGNNFVARVVVWKVTPLVSSAKLVKNTGCLDDVRPGWWAKRISRQDKYVTNILVEPPRDHNEEARRAIQQLMDEWRQHTDSANVPLEFYFDGDQQAPSPAYRVRISESLEFEILDREQNALRSMPRLKTTDPRMAEKLVAQLTHLQMYQVVMDLRPASEVSDKEFGKKYEFSITEVQDEEYEEEEMEFEEEQQGNPTLKSYDINFINVSSEDLYVTILSLSMLRGVHRAFPIEGEGSQLVEPGRSIVPMRLEIFKPDFLDHKDCLNKGNEMVDILKVLVTLEPHNFDHFLLHDLDQDAMETSKTTEWASRSSPTNVQEKGWGTRSAVRKHGLWGVGERWIKTDIS